MPAVHELRSALALAAPPAEVFAFLIRPANGPTLTDPDAGVRWLSGPEVMTRGSVNELEVRGFGLPRRVVYEVAAFEDRGAAGGSFTETMTDGPLPRFETDHVVAPAEAGETGGANGAGGCVLTETYRFAPPGGLLGLTLTADRLRGELDRGVRYRHAALIARFGAGGSETPG